MMAQEGTNSRSRFGTVGRELGLVGRALRFLIGVAMTARVTNSLATTDHTLVLASETAFYFLVALAAYGTTYYLLKDLVFARLNPWIGTAIVLTPVLIVLFFDVGPAPFGLGIRLFVGVSLIVTAMMRYGGCEVVAIPSIVFGGRHVLYCPYNVIDVAEKAVVDRRKAP